MNHIKEILGTMSTLLMVLLILPVAAQTPLVYNDGSTIYVDGTTFTVVGTGPINGIQNAESTDNSRLIIRNEGVVVASDLLNSDSVLIESGLLHLTEGYKAQSSDAYIENEDTILINAGWKNGIGTHYSTPGGNAVLVLNFNVAGTFEDDSSSTFNQIDFDGGFNIDVIGTVVAHSLKFIDGVVEVSDNDTLIKYEGDIINPFNPSSFVAGKLYQYDQGAFEFPVGTTTLGNRPAGIRNLTSPTWVAMEVIENNATTNPLSEGNKVDVLYDNFYVEVDFEESYDGSAHIVLSTVEAEITGFGGTNAGTIVAWSDDPSNDFVSYGATTSSTPIDPPFFAATSTSLATDGYYLLGSECIGFKINVVALLEGAYNGTYAPDPNYVNLLDDLYGDNAGGTAFTDYKSMYSGLFPSSNASNQPIDVVKIYILNPTAPFVKRDSAYAWLMEDGSILDFETASENYVSICNPAIVNGGAYRIGLKAKNHLPVMSDVPLIISTTVPVTIDFTDVVNIYGAMATKNIAGKDMLVAGEVTGDNAINAADYFNVMQQVYQLHTDVYMKQDLNLDADVNGGDYNLIDYNSVRLYYSTFPE